MSPPFKATPKMVGIDKVLLTTSDYSLDKKNNFDWSVQFSKRTGQEKKKHWCNSNGINYNINDKGLAVQFNPSKQKHPYHLHGLDSVAEAMAMIEKDSKEQGLSFNPDRCRVSRLDLAKQDEMQHPFMVYAPVYRSLDAKYSPHKRDYGSTFLFGNRSRQTCIYDKIAEVQRHRKMDFPEKNLMRMETRFMGSRVLKSIAKTPSGFSFTAQDLLEWSDQSITLHFHDHIKHRILTLNPDSFDAKELPLYRKQVEYMRMMHEKYNRQGWSKLWVLGMMQSGQWMMQHFGDMEMIAGIMDDAGLTKKQKQRAKKDFERMMELPALDSMKGRKGVQIRELYSELVEKFVA